VPSFFEILAIMAVFALFATVVVVIAIVRFFKPSYAQLAKGTNGKMTEPSDACAACGSGAITFLADRVYVCPECGYEGGEGIGDLQWQQKITSLAALSPEDRAERVFRLRADIRLTMLSLKYDLDAAETALKQALGIDPADNQRAEAEQLAKDLTAGCTTRLMETIALVEEASHLTAGAGRLTALYDYLAEGKSTGDDLVGCQLLYHQLSRRVA